MHVSLGVAGCGGLERHLTLNIRRSKSELFGDVTAALDAAAVLLGVGGGE